MPSVQKGLAWRLALAALALASALGAAAYFYEMERVDEAVVSMAVRESDVFKQHLGSAITMEHMRHHDTLDAALEEFVRSRATVDTGHYVSVELYGPDQKEAADAHAGGYDVVKNVIDKRKHQFFSDKVWYERFRVGGSHYIFTLIPLHDPRGALVGYFEGVFHISSETLSGIHDTVATIIFVVIGVVLLTTLVLYPVITALNRDLVTQSHNLLRANLHTLEALGGAIAKRDSDTHAHNFRVCVYSVRLGEAIGLPAEAIRNLLKGAFLHDVGKIAIADAILLKPAKLSEAEFQTMKSHVLHGLDIVSHSPWLADAADVVRFHHEKFDGSGYMAGLAGEDIPIAARIFAIADVFDALTSRRPYKEPMPFDEAMAILYKDSGSHFDPQLVDAFANIAQDLYDRFGTGDNDRAEGELRELTARYFGLEGP
ncbi:MAG: HD domain-containing protein [Alphaproteobacteria bacterium]|nr:HD domain-containing protein [Alphaproteobacteria bacterium]MBF0128418.1 HD domain-containing protein [Alphaproteobacteria bacterium]